MNRAPRTTMAFVAIGGWVRVRAECACGQAVELDAPRGKNGRPRVTARVACPGCGEQLTARRIPGQPPAGRSRRATAPAAAAAPTPAGSALVDSGQGAAVARKYRIV